MLAQLARTLTEWHCNSITDLIDEMELWDWNVANKDFWSRLAKSLHSQKVSVIWAEKMDKKLASVLVPEKMSWATATRSIRKCRTRIERIGGSRVDTEPTAWGLDVQVRNLLWTGEEAMKKGIPILKRAGFESVEDLPRTAVLVQKHIRICHHSSGCPQRRMVGKESECVYPMRKDFTAPPYFLCRST